MVLVRPETSRLSDAPDLELRLPLVESIADRGSLRRTRHARESRVQQMKNDERREGLIRIISIDTPAADPIQLLLSPVRSWMILTLWRELLWLSANVGASLVQKRNRTGSSLDLSLRCDLRMLSGSQMHSTTKVRNKSFIIKIQTQKIENKTQGLDLNRSTL